VAAIEVRIPAGVIKTVKGGQKSMRTTTITGNDAPDEKGSTGFFLDMTRLFRCDRENTSDFLIATDPSGKIRLISPNVASLLGCGASELQGVNIRSLFGDGEEHATDIIEYLTAERELQNREMVLLRNNRDSLRVLVSASLLVNGSDPELGAIFLVREKRDKVRRQRCRLDLLGGEESAQCPA
jgi:PAS domain S-box-containing protein